MPHLVAYLSILFPVNVNPASMNAETAPIGSKETPYRLSYLLWLQEEFVLRCRKNPAYSIRAFALLLKTDSSSLSQILSGKRNASVKMIERFANAIGVTPEVRASILADARSKGRKKILTTHNRANEDYLSLSADVFNVMADWHHYAILEISKVEGFRPEPQWIARKLNISATEVKIAVNRLLRLGLAKNVNGKFSATSKKMTNEGATKTSDAMRMLQRQLLEKALLSIDFAEYDRKDITSMTMAIDERKLSQARDFIRDFRRQLCEFLEDGVPTAVFNLGIQLFPLTEPIEKKD